jgi:16S rRNA (adenine1518-N6/adenine1519-N6)-dimethyltransferase
MAAKIRPLKKLGQHFLTDLEIAEKIASLPNPSQAGYETLIEIGPGTGVLTTHFVSRDIPRLICIEVDGRSVDHLKARFSDPGIEVINGDFLETDLRSLTNGEQFGVTGNFPYNISSQIMFRVLDHWDRIPEITGMFQDEVARRICSKPGSKTYGILSVLLQAYYDTEYKFMVPPDRFDPPPKVNSGVIRLLRKSDAGPGCDPQRFKTVVKTAFNQRRKTLRNSLRSIYDRDPSSLPFSDKRPEQLTHEQFSTLTQAIFPEKSS